MKCNSVVSYSLVVIIFVTSLFSCSKNSNTLRETNEFIQNFLDKNSITVYKSEIQRVKVNIFPASNMLVYSFWKEERFYQNGDLYLHLYPIDSNNLIEPRKKHKFVNLSISKNAFLRGKPPYLYKFENLQLPYKLASIQTGQFNKSGKTWKSDFRGNNSLNDEFHAKQALLAGKNSFYALNLLKGLGKVEISPILGAKISQSPKDGIKAVYYNVNLNRFTYLFDEHKIDKWKNSVLFVDMHYPGQKVKRRTVSFDKILGIEDLKIILCDLPLNQKFEKFEIGQEVDGIESIWKSFDTKKLVYTSFPLISNEAKNGSSITKDNEIEIINYLMLNNIPMVYYNFEKKLCLFFNKNRRTAYIVSNNADDFDSLELKSIIGTTNETTTKDIRLKNSFFIKGENKQIVVHELKLEKGIEGSELLLILGNKELYKQTVEQINN